jgi:pimeloyl-ACP methyl ester carboxylesterase
MTNPGGPGASGVNFLLQNAELGAQLVGSNFDLVSWDPRGVGYSVPAANCTLSSDLTGLRRRTLDKLSGPEFPTSFFEIAFEQSKEIGQECQASIGGPDQAGPHMTTATTAHDMVSILDAFAASSDSETCKDASLLNYWGFSYGTMLGQTFASMFPERVGRMVLDGVVDPDVYITGLNTVELSFTDDIISTFFLYCSLAGPSSCAFATGSTPHDVYLRFENIVSRLNASQAIEQNWNNATAIELALIGLKQFAFTFTYNPIGNFPVMAQLLVALEAILPNLTIEGLQELEKLSGATPSGITVDQLWGRAIRCSDTNGALFNQTLQEWASIIQAHEKESFIGGELGAQIGIECTGWPIVSDYRFPGKFPGTLPISSPQALISIRSVWWKDEKPSPFREQHTRPGYSNYEVSSLEKGHPSTLLTTVVAKRGRGSSSRHNCSLSKE